jgi:hypothetical protein
MIVLESTRVSDTAQMEFGKGIGKAGEMLKQLVPDIQKTTELMR